MPDTIMLPVKPVYADAILDGSKRYEFRRTKPRWEPDSVVLYASAPVKQVVGEARVHCIFTGTPEHIWETCKDAAGISHEDYMRYFAGAKTAYALVLLDPERFNPPRTLADYGIKRAPQSFVYLPD